MKPWLPSSGLDRGTVARGDADWVRRAWADPRARVLMVDGNGLVAANETGGRLRFVQASGDYDPERALLLGTVGSVPHFAAVGELDGPAATLRQVVGRMPDSDADLATTALAITNWHRVAPFCGACGGPTEVRAAGHVRYCPSCDRDRFPRTDPAVIVAVLDDDRRLLLGHHVSWPVGRVSLLAGFVEAGESLEMTVVREVAEEAGIEVDDVRYVASQPWPLPRSLMLGFTAHAALTEVAADGLEIEHARFYTREEVLRLSDSGELSLPAHASIASAMIGEWLAGRL